MAHDYQVYEKHLADTYRQAVERYRRDDEIEVSTANHRRICGNLARISSSFERKINVLDVGCGTGRHFHCLKEAELLVGVDISAEMLRAAENPVKGEHVSIGSIRLLQRNIYEHTFPSGMFDLIYSFGVFGHGARLTVDLCRKFHDWLGHGGRLYLDTIESSGAPALVLARQRIKRIIYPLLPISAFRRMSVTRHYGTACISNASQPKADPGQHWLQCQAARHLHLHNENTPRLVPLCLHVSRSRACHRSRG